MGTRHRSRPKGQLPIRHQSRPTGHPCRAMEGTEPPPEHRLTRHPCRLMGGMAARAEHPCRVAMVVTGARSVQAATTRWIEWLAMNIQCTDYVVKCLLLTPIMGSDSFAF